MTSDEVMELFRKTGALLEGHFQYASGRHGKQFLQASRVVQWPQYTEQLCKGLAAPFANDGIELVVGPATGGIILAYETARHLNCRAAFTEKDTDGGMSLKRGLALKQGMKVLVVEDIITTGGSVQKTVDHLRGRGASIVGVSVLVDRSGGEAKFDCRYVPLARFTLESWPADSCPLCTKGVPRTEPDELIV
jgi:orotate phosphoribosyltransferase